MEQITSDRAKRPYPLSRRSFLGATAALAVSLAVRSEDLEETAAMAAGPFVDVHTHLGQTWGNRPALDAEGLLRWMDSRNIAQAVVLPLVSPESWDHILTPDYVLHQTEPFRDRLIPFCAIDPRTINLNSYQLKLDLLLRYKEAGARGFGEHKCGIAMDDPRNVEMFAACAEAKLPVLFHMDNSRNMDAPGLPGLTKVLEQVPEGVFVGHANGWWASISSDCTQEDMESYPDRAVTPGGPWTRSWTSSRTYTATCPRAAAPTRSCATWCSERNLSFAARIGFFLELTTSRRDRKLCNSVYSTRWVCRTT